MQINQADNQQDEILPGPAIDQSGGDESTNANDVEENFIMQTGDDFESDTSNETRDNEVII